VIKKSPNEFRDDDDNDDDLDDVEKQLREFDLTMLTDVKETNVDSVLSDDEVVDNSGVRTRLKDNQHKLPIKRHRRRKHVNFIIFFFYFNISCTEHSPFSNRRFVISC